MIKGCNVCVFVCVCVFEYFRRCDIQHMQYNKLCVESRLRVEKFTKFPIFLQKCE
jgi:hypothetical protein